MKWAFWRRSDADGDAGRGARDRGRAADGRDADADAAALKVRARRRLIGAAALLLAAVVLDQKYRCRTCLRRLRMPVMAGSWPNSFLRGAPRTEYICPYGHGTLRVPELQIAGRENSRWRENEDLWTELERQDTGR
ncbi:MAG TPA: hypothetical protein DEH78_20350 [Solibacterales bacterium]|nr:hypothetical protein [Bryobacterales bacterium]